MKSIFACLFLFFFTILHAQTKIAGLTNNGTWSEDPNDLGDLGYLTPCQTYTFRVDYTPPAGTTLSKVDWYYGTTFLKTVTGTNQTTIDVPFKGDQYTNYLYAIITYSNAVTQTTDRFIPYQKATTVRISSSTNYNYVPGCSNSASITFTSAAYDPPKPITTPYYKPTNYTVTYYVPSGKSA